MSKKDIAACVVIGLFALTAGIFIIWIGSKSPDDLHIQLRGFPAPPTVTVK